VLLRTMGTRISIKKFVSTNSTLEASLVRTYLHHKGKKRNLKYRISYYSFNECSNGMVVLIRFFAKEIKSSVWIAEFSLPFIMSFARCVSKVSVDEFLLTRIQ